MCIYYTIYKTTNKINGFIYIGQHITKNPYDSYLGSGLKLKNAITKYGRGSFVKEVLYIFDSFDAMNQKEAELITEDFIKNNNTYNIVTGGSFGIGLNNKGKTAWNKGLTGAQSHSKDTRKKMSDSARKPKTEEHRKNISLGKSGLKKGPPSTEHKNKISQSLTGRTFTEEHKQKLKGPKSPETIQKMKDGWAKKRAAKAALKVSIT